MTNFDSSAHPRVASGEFTAKDQTAPEADLSPASARVMVTVQPQYWDARDYARDAGPSVEFDIAGILQEMDEGDLQALVDGSDDGDNLYFEAVRRGLVEDGFGPFYVDCQNAVEDYVDGLSDGEPSLTPEQEEEQGVAVIRELAAIARAEHPDAVYMTVVNANDGPGSPFYQISSVRDSSDAELWAARGFDEVDEFGESLNNLAAGIWGAEDRLEDMEAGPSGQSPLWKLTLDH